MIAQPSRPIVTPAGPVPRFFAGVLVGFLGRLPRRGLRALSRFLGALVWGLGIRRSVTIDNLRHAFPELEERERRRIARGAYANMALTALESLATSARGGAGVDRLVRFSDDGFLDRLRAQGRGVLIATAHMGNWEILGAALPRRGIPLHAVVRPLKGALNERIVNSRLESGIALIAARGAVRGMLKAVGEGAVVAQLIDQVVPADKGVFVPFFGRPASTTPGLALVARRTGAPIVLGMGVREGDQITLHFEGPFPVPETHDADADIRALTATLTAAIEKWIRRYPEQWLWLHRRWKVQPPG